MVVRAMMAVVVGGAVLAGGLLAGCDETKSSGGGTTGGGGSAVTNATHQSVTIGGKRFSLELALDDEHRFKGLSGRTEIPADGGMLFAFRQPSVHAFVMRDCPVPIDIIYLDANGRITAMHAMQPEPPRTEAEKAMQPQGPGAPAWAVHNPAYEERLKRYSSRFPAQFAIELRGGTLPGLGLKEGDKIDLPVQELARRAK